MSGGCWLEVQVHMLAPDVSALPHVLERLPDEIAGRLGNGCSVYRGAGWASVACSGVLVLIAADVRIQGAIGPGPPMTPGGRVRVRLQASGAEEAQRALAALGDASRRLGLLLELQL